MKMMTCKQLGGACDLEFKAETFQEMAAMSQAHGKDMFTKGDEAHLNAMKAKRAEMQIPGAMEKWMAEVEAQFNALPNL